MNDHMAKKTVARMLEHDLFSQWLGIEVIDVAEGYSKIKMTVRKEMVNGFGIAHGGIAFSLADSAFAFACNSDGKVTVALDTNMSFPKVVKVGDVLIAEGKRLNQTRSTGLYFIEIKNQNDELVGVFKGTCFRTGKALE